MGLVEDLFYKIGKTAAFRPYSSICIGLIIIAVGSIGFINYESTFDPVEMFIAQNSRTNVEHEYYADRFGFYPRQSRGWITPLDNNKDDDLFQKPYLDMLYHL